ncbi:alpha/beta hydrolase [Halocynthiibacter styelae]|uniref:Alpha/beta fold hydrolase n=1 Tax=Halocynthiibacter styelae TaxID=2761955 RepID=A0A8J7LTT4_9RHOB|nr:alpha/beta fold hydrolase [Paenihalocynthiibacter styelae]MBI1492172.1 alpha/beta fold hydrolase [Paenihalocynthiibacter styelae]
MRELEFKKREAQSGTAKNVVIFLHGYGADGADLLGLADPLAPHMPDTAFYAPDAPERPAAMPMGRQWFSIPWIDGSSEEESAAGLERAAEDLNAFLDKVIADEGITASEVVLLGFSQGTMMALHVGPRRQYKLAGIVGFSGRLLAPERLEADFQTRPPVLLIHGDQDDVVPPQSLNEAAEGLQTAGFDVYSHIMKGTAHGIAPDGLSVALTFMREMLGQGEN